MSGQENVGAGDALDAAVGTAGGAPEADLHAEAEARVAAAEARVAKAQAHLDGANEALANAKAELKEV